jgi:hypothetical protein
MARNIYFVGTHIIYPVLYDSKFAPESFTLYAVPRTGGQAFAINSTPARFANIAPDGHTIIYETFPKDSQVMLYSAQCDEFLNSKRG